MALPTRPKRRSRRADTLGVPPSARPALPPRRDLGRPRRQPRGLRRARQPRRVVALRRCLRRAPSARSTLPERTGPVWHGYLPGIGPGSCTAARARSLGSGRRPPLQPRQGPARPVRARDRPAAPVASPASPAAWAAARRAPSSSTRRPTRRSARSSTTSTGRACRRRASRGRTRSSTRRTSAGSRCGTPACPRSTAAPTSGLVSDSVLLEHLRDLGVTTVQLLPIQSIVQTSGSSTWASRTTGATTR
jgi:hypothetical protein